MLEYSVSQLPPQDPNDYPYIKGIGAQQEGAIGVDNPVAVLSGPHVAGYPWHVAGYPWAGSGMPYPAGPHPFGGLPPSPAAPGGYPWNGPTPVPHSPYPPMGLNPVPGIVWNDPVLMCERKRSATRKVSLTSGIIGLITMVIQMAIIVTMFLAIGYTGQQGEFLLFMSLLIVVLAPMAVGLGWVTTFILALVACIQARSRTPQVQPDGWIQAKTPTLALLVTSIVTGLPTLIMYVVLYEALSRDYTDEFIDGFLEPLLMFCGLTQVLIVVGFVFLLRMSKALDPAVRASQAPGGQPA